MGHQILIIALTGTHNPALPADLAQQLSKQGFEIRHACLSYEGRTTFAVGAPDDLARELAEAGHPTGITLETTDEAKGTTLETVLEEFRAHRAEFKEFVAYEKREDKDDLKAPKAPKAARAKKEAAPPETPPAPQEQSAPEGTGSAPPEPTEAANTDAPEANPAPSPGDVPAAPNAQEPGNQES